MRLHLNCHAEYLESFLSEEEANELFDHLAGFPNLTQPLKIETATGETFQSPTGKIMFIDSSLKEANRFPEEIWGFTKAWSASLHQLRERVEEHTGEVFKTCVCVYYPDGTSGITYHSDLPAFGDTDVIPSVSLGAVRDFCFREKANGEVYEMTLAHGSMVVMGAHCQERYEHALPLAADCNQPRINLTFRKFGEG